MSIVYVVLSGTGRSTVWYYCCMFMTNSKFERQRSIISQIDSVISHQKGSAALQHPSPVVISKTNKR